MLGIAIDGLTWKLFFLFAQDFNNQKNLSGFSIQSSTLL